MLVSHSYCELGRFVTGASAGTLVVDININLWWGSVLLRFGGAMVLLACRASAMKTRQFREPRSG